MSVFSRFPRRAVSKWDQGGDLRATAPGQSTTPLMGLGTKRFAIILIHNCHTA